MLQAPARQTIRRFDDQLLITLNLHGEDVDQAPLLHIRYEAPGGLFDRLVQQYDDLWDQAAQPIDPDLDLDYEDRHERPDPAAPDHAAGRPEGVNDDSALPPRRWPRRPA